MAPSALCCTPEAKELAMPLERLYGDYASVTIGANNA